MQSIILNDGTYIYNEYTMRESLEALGYDINSLREMLCEDMIEDSNWYKEQYKETKRYSEGLYEHLHGMYNEITEIADKLASGKGGTKVQYADHIKKTCEYWV